MKSNSILIFIINLKQDTLRKKHMQELCKKYNLQVEFIEAVDGRALNTNKVEKVYSSKKAIDKIGRELSRGEIGCALSHKKIYQRIVDENISEAIVLEDDINFNKELLEILQKVDNFPNRWNIVLLGHHACLARDLETCCSFWERKSLNKKYMIARPCEIGCGTYGYILRLEAAIILLQDLEVIDRPIDHFTGSDEKLSLYVLTPPVVDIHQALSGNHAMKDRKTLQVELSRINKQKPIIYSGKRKILIFFHLDGIWDSLNRKYISMKHFFKKRRKYEKCA